MSHKGNFQMECPGDFDLNICFFFRGAWKASESNIVVLFPDNFLP